MSMLFSLRRVSNDDLQHLIADPSDIHFFLYGAEPYQAKPSLFKRWLSGKKAQAPQQRNWQAPPTDMELDLEKNWHILHYLFCRSAWEGTLPEATLLAGGVNLGEVDVGYGPARALQKEEINTFLSFLDSLQKESFGLHLSAQEVEENQIYFQDWMPEYGQTLWSYVLELRQFFKAAMDAGDGIILYMY